MFAHAMRSLTRPSVPGPSVPGPTLLAISKNRRPVGRKSLLCSLTRCARSRDALAHATIRPRTIRPRTYPSCNPRLMAGIPFPPEPPNITDFDCQISPGVFHLSVRGKMPRPRGLTISFGNGDKYATQSPAC